MAYYVEQVSAYHHNINKQSMGMHSSKIAKISRVQVASMLSTNGILVLMMGPACGQAQTRCDLH